jgi:hypothetical protein
MLAAMLSAWLPHKMLPAFEVSMLWLTLYK